MYSCMYINSNLSISEEVHVPQITPQEYLKRLAEFHEPTSSTSWTSAPLCHDTDLKAKVCPNPPTPLQPSNLNMCQFNNMGGYL